MTTSSDTKLYPLCIAVLTVSDTRDHETDSSGAFLAKALTDQGHHLHGPRIVRDDIYQIRAVLSDWIANPNIQAIITNGGTGFSSRDSTPEAVSPLFDKNIEGFGELFRQFSFKEIGSSTLQSRSIAGIANNTIIFSLPGSTAACATGWNHIISEQLDSTFQPCNFIAHLRDKG
ncbi:MAG: molybdenum cofactor biosynthesis protein B [Porticoccaceae bacterium]|mgnify:FL=1|nr:molybdenum cofactor biosynthesis protein B [Porticoccaceae bacterium]|tara:strand:- start:972 stop:1493 length:522 start_codon:yes stop_codon:yes gene_type:complete